MTFDEFAARHLPSLLRYVGFVGRGRPTIAGRSAQCSLSRCNIDYGDYLVSIGTGFTRTELERIVAGLQLADPADPATWFAIDEAIPGL